MKKQIGEMGHDNAQILDVVLDKKWKIIVQKITQTPEISLAIYSNSNLKASAVINSFYKLEMVEFMGNNGEKYPMMDPNNSGVFTYNLPISYVFTGTILTE